MFGELVGRGLVYIWFLWDDFMEVICFLEREILFEGWFGYEEIFFNRVKNKVIRFRIVYGVIILFSL